MGITAFSEWIKKNVNFFNSIKIPAQGFNTDQNRIFTLSIDTNTLIYDGLADFLFQEKDNVTKTTGEDNIYTAVFNNFLTRLEKLIAFFPNIKVLLISIDGVPPIGKIQQQRRSRQKSGLKKGKTNQTLKDNVVEEEEDIITETTSFGSGNISPGSKFMIFFNEKLKDHFTKKPPDFQVIYSSSLNPGEGEHKIMDYYRKWSKFYDNQLRHVVYTNDSDLFLLCVLNPLKNIFMLMPEKNKIKNNGDRELFILYSIELLKTYIVKDFFSMENFFIILMFIGNDFLPQFKLFDNYKLGLNLLIDDYKKITSSLSEHEKKIKEKTTELDILEENISTKKKELDNLDENNRKLFAKKELEDYALAKTKDKKKFNYSEKNKVENNIIENNKKILALNNDKSQLKSNKKLRKEINLLNYNKKKINNLITLYDPNQKKINFEGLSFLIEILAIIEKGRILDVFSTLEKDFAEKNTINNKSHSYDEILKDLKNFINLGETPNSEVYDKVYDRFYKLWNNRAICPKLSVTEGNLLYEKIQGKKNQVDYETSNPLAYVRNLFELNTNCNYGVNVYNLSKNFLIGIEWVFKYYMLGYESVDQNWFYPHFYAPVFNDLHGYITHGENFKILDNLEKAKTEAEAAIKTKAVIKTNATNKTKATNKTEAVIKTKAVIKEEINKIQEKINAFNKENISLEKFPSQEKKDLKNHYNILNQLISIIPLNSKENIPIKDIDDKLYSSISPFYDLFPTKFIGNYNGKNYTKKTIYVPFFDQTRMITAFSICDKMKYEELKKFKSTGDENFGKIQEYFKDNKFLKDGKLSSIKVFIDNKYKQTINQDIKLKGFQYLYNEGTFYPFGSKDENFTFTPLPDKKKEIIIPSPPSS